MKIRALIFEDSRNGLLAVRGAGLRTVVTPSIYTKGEDFTGAPPLFTDLAEFHAFAARLTGAGPKAVPVP